MTFDIKNATRRPDHWVRRQGGVVDYVERGTRRDELRLAASFVCRCPVPSAYCWLLPCKSRVITLQLYTDGRPLFFFLKSWAFSFIYSDACVIDVELSRPFWSPSVVLLLVQHSFGYKTRPKGRVYDVYLILDFSLCPVAWLYLLSYTTFSALLIEKENSQRNKNLIGFAKENPDFLLFFSLHFECFPLFRSDYLNNKTPTHFQFRYLS